MNNEFDFIHQLFQSKTSVKHPLTQLGIGDDASVHAIPAGFELVVSTDTAIEGVHWPEDFPLDLAAGRAVNAALSDLAAMGAKASWVWLAITGANKEALQAMSLGIVSACEKHQVELAGGDTTRSPAKHPINSLSLTVGGLIPEGKSMCRNQAKIGDDVWLAGNLGLSAAGLKQWFAKQRNGTFVSHFSHIEPLLDIGSFLLAQDIQCCIDISDGLLQDASHIAKASKLHINFCWEALQKLPSFAKLSVDFNEDVVQALMLTGGEDYALLFTAPADKREHLEQADLHLIGVCQQGAGVSINQAGQAMPVKKQGFDHFA